MSMVMFSFLLSGGLLSGLLTGLLGVGGGVVMVPFLYQLFLLHGETQRAAFTTAVATSLFVMIFTGTYAALIHRRNGMLERDLVVYTGLGAIIGALFGAQLMIASDDQVVRLCFGIFLWVVALSMYLPKAKEREVGQKTSRTYRWSLVLTGCFMGVVSGLFGIGGTTLLVPAMVIFFGVTIHRAIATATALIVVAAFVGASSYLLLGWSNPHTIAGGVGWIHPMAAVVMIPCAFFSSRLGIKIAMRLSRAHLKNIMVLFQFLVGARFIFGS
jgi:uncharacterized protein